MQLLFCLICVIVVEKGYCVKYDGDMLMTTLDAFTRGVEYMHRKVDEINLDAVFCLRLVQEQLQSYLTNQPEVFHHIRTQLEELRDTAKQVADEAIPRIYATSPRYAQHVGLMLNENKKLPWYPSLETSHEYAVEAVPCSAYHYEALKEDECFHRLSGGAGKECDVPAWCYEMNERYYQRSYGLTHQVIFWHSLEAHECVESVSYDRRMRLCSNVMRDCNRTAAAHFPEAKEDVFMEQVGFCGFWGFRDFSKSEWLGKILEWQDDSGCFKGHESEYCFDAIPEETHKRVKRSERQLQDGCFSHSTAVALLALVVSVRFEAEKHHQRMTENLNLNIHFNYNHSMLFIYFLSSFVVVIFLIIVICK